MLMLTRNLGESIYLYDTTNDSKTKILIVRQQGYQIKIGIDAPSHIDILREELFESYMLKKQRQGEIP